MKISNNYSPNFGIKFIKNDAFKEVEKYARSIKREKDFQDALSRLEGSIEGDVLITHGVDSKGKHFSSFTLADMTLENTPYYLEPYIETTFRAIKDLSNFTGRYKTLTGTNQLRTRC